MTLAHKMHIPYFHSYLVTKLVETLEYLKVGAYPRGHVVKPHPDLLHVFQDATVRRHPSNMYGPGCPQIRSTCSSPLDPLLHDLDFRALDIKLQDCVYLSTFGQTQNIRISDY